MTADKIELLSELAIWKRRALAAERELAELRTELRQARQQRAQSPRYEPEVEHGVGNLL